MRVYRKKNYSDGKSSGIDSFLLKQQAFFIRIEPVDGSR